MEKKIDLGWLLRVRVVVARCGEMDALKWWNTNGQSGPYGAKVLKRGFPRTHYFAQARSVFAVAAHRCAEIYDPPDAVTLWRLPDDVEEAFDAHWEGWLDTAESWSSFFEAVAALKDFDVANALKGLTLVDGIHVETASILKIDGGGRGVLLPGSFELGRQSVSLLALGFDKGAKGDLLVPYMRPTPVFSQRFLRKGPLVEETYRLFVGWKDDASVEANMETAFRDRFPTISWAKEVRLTTSGRLRNLDAARPLIVLARNGMKLDDWRDCWRLWIGATEEPFGGFVRDWLFPQMQSGCHHVRAQDVREYAIKAWSLHSAKRPLSEHGVVRAARDLVHTAAQLELLSGNGPVKTFSAISNR